MKRVFLAALLIPSLSYGAAFDMFINQRNIADSATLNRTITLPVLGAYSVFGIGPDNLPAAWKLGSSLGLLSGELVSSPDWGAVVNKPVFSAVATSGSYNDLTNKPSFGQVNADWSATTGPEEILNKPALFSGVYADLTGKPSLFSGAYADLTGKPALFSGNYADLSGKPVLATVATSGSYADLSGKPTMTGGTVTSITAGAGLSGGTITTTGTISLPSVGSAGSYNTVTTDAQGRVSSGTMRTQAAATRALNSAFQVSTTRDAVVQYSVQTTITASIAGGQDADVFLDIASDSGFTANVQSLDVAPCSQTYTLAVAIQGVQKCAAQVRGFVPAGYYARIRTVSNTGSPVFAYRLGQEVLQ